MRDLYNDLYAAVQKREVPNEYKEKAVEWLNPQRDDRILEIGSGNCDFVYFLQKLSPRTIGLDINPTRAIGTKAKIVTADATELPFRKDAFNKTLSIHTLEHIPDLGRVLRELNRVTSLNGLSLHAFPAEWWRGKGALKEARELTGNIINAFLLSRKLHAHKLDPSRLEAFLKGTDWEIIRAEKQNIPIEEGPAWFVLLKRSA